MPEPSADDEAHRDVDDRLAKAQCKIIDGFNEWDAILSQTKSENEKLKISRKRLSNDLSDVQAKLKAVVSERDELAKEKSELRTDHDSLEVQLNTATDRNEKLQRDLDAANQKVIDLITSVKDAERSSGVQDQTANQAIERQNQILRDQVAGFRLLEKRLKTQREEDDKKVRAHHRDQVASLEEELRFCRSSNKAVWDSMGKTVQDNLRAIQHVKTTHQNEMMHFQARYSELIHEISHLEHSVYLYADQVGRSEAGHRKTKVLLEANQTELQRLSHRMESLELELDVSALRSDKGTATKRLKPTWREVWIFDTPPPSSAKKYHVENGVVRDESGHWIRRAGMGRRYQRRGHEGHPSLDAK